MIQSPISANPDFANFARRLAEQVSGGRAQLNEADPQAAEKLITAVDQGAAEFERETGKPKAETLTETMSLIELADENERLMAQIRSLGAQPRTSGSGVGRQFALSQNAALQNQLATLQAPLRQGGPSVAEVQQGIGPGVSRFLFPDAPVVQNPTGGGFAAFAGDLFTPPVGLPESDIQNLPQPLRPVARTGNTLASPGSIIAGVAAPAGIGASGLAQGTGRGAAAARLLGDTPGRALAAEAGAELAQQSAAEAGAPLPVQIGAGLAGGVGGALTPNIARGAQQVATDPRRALDQVSPVGSAQAMTPEQQLHADSAAARASQSAERAGEALPEGAADDLVQAKAQEFADRARSVTQITQDLRQQFAASEPLKGAARAERVKELRKRQAGTLGAVQKAHRDEGEGAFIKARGATKGDKADINFEPPVLQSGDAHTLFTYINDQPALTPFQKDNTSFALRKLLDGQNPQPRELRLLERTFGRDFVESFLEGAGRGTRRGSIIRDIFGVPKSLRSAYDLSAPLRQGLLLGPRNPREYAAAWKSMFQSFRKGDAFTINREIITDPDIDGLMDNGLFMQSVEGAGRAGDEAFDEQFISRYANRIPGVGLSERTYGTFLNKLKHDVAKKTLNKWRMDGTLPPDVPLNQLDLDPAQAKKVKDLARFLNVMTGRGTVPEKYRGVADLMNIALWSPRLTISRFEAPLLVFGPNVDRSIRIAAAQNMAATFGLGATILAIAEASMPGVTVEKDPRSSDFGKMRFGDTRLDFWGGFQPIARYMAQIVTNETKATTSDTTSFGKGDIGQRRNTSRLDRVVRFVRSKVSPGLSTIIANEFAGSTFLDSPLEDRPNRGRPPESIGRILRGEQELLGRDVNPLKQVTPGGLDSAREQEGALQGTPLFAIELIEAMENYGMFNGAMLSIPTLFGVGTQTFNSPLKEAS